MKTPNGLSIIGIPGSSKASHELYTLLGKAYPALRFEHTDIPLASIKPSGNTQVVHLFVNYRGDEIIRASRELVFDVSSSPEGVYTYEEAMELFNGGYNDG